MPNKLLSSLQGCELCATAGGAELWHDNYCRVVRVKGAEGAAFPGFCRVIWQTHVSEMSQLTTAHRHHLLSVVCAVETALCHLVRPDKINLASLGNSVAHLHWHIIPRWHDDSHFPASIWAAPIRPARPRPIPADTTLTKAIISALDVTIDVTNTPTAL